MKKFESGKLHVVLPSIVVFDDSRLISETKQSRIYEHMVEFKTNPKNIDIVYPKLGSYYVFESIFNGDKVFRGVPNHCIEGFKHIDIIKDDIMLLSKYLYEKKVDSPIWTAELGKYIESLKPYYELEELEKILFELKEEQVDECKIKLYKKNYKI